MWKPDEKTIFMSAPPYTMATGGIEAFETTALTDEEEDTIDEYLNTLADEMAKISPKIANDFRQQINMMKDAASHFKAKVGEKPYAPTIDSPDPGQLGINPIIPQWFNKNQFTIDVTEGSAAYLWGGAASWFKTTSTVDQRFMIFIMQNGIIHITDTPVTKQFKYETEKKGYAPFSVHPLTIETIEENKTIYQYPTFAANLLTWDLGTKMSFMPTRTASGVSYELIGIVLYEYNAYSSLVDLIHLI
jgi:hypothetical protein